MINFSVTNVDNYDICINKNRYFIQNFQTHLVTCEFDIGDTTMDVGDKMEIFTSHESWPMPMKNS